MNANTLNQTQNEHNELFKQNQLIAQPSSITNIKFSLLSSETIREISVLQVTSTTSIENGVPKTGGLLDSRLGSIERNILCSTCLQSKECPGHFAYIELRRRVLNPAYVSKIKKILESVCLSCSKILYLNSSFDDSEGNKKSLQEVWTKSKNRKTCPSCTSKQPLIKKDGLTLYANKSDDTTDTKLFLSGDRIHEIFSKIPDTHLSHMNLCQTTVQSMLIKNLLVPPVSVRPSIVMEGLRAEDDLTHKLSDILKSNKILEQQEIEGAPSHVLREFEQLLQFHVATFMNNDLSGIPQSLQKSGRPIKSISSRLKGKEGRVRGNLMGKRVDFSSRSVITAEPNINIDELGVPREIAMVQTFPEHVTELNIQHLQNICNNGPLVYPGANFIIRKDGSRIDLRFASVDLELGMIVERHMVDGDIILFNRQPSLHKMSMMSHRVKIMNGESFRLNLSATPPYNADFDGDEMNMHMPQSLNSVSELELCKVERNILSPQSSSPCMFIVQDSLVGIYLLTGLDLLDEFKVFNYLYRAKIDNLLNNKGKAVPSVLRPLRMYTGKQVFSLLLPKDLHYKNSKLEIRNSILIKGRVCKKSVGGSHHSLIHIIFLDYGYNRCAKFINNIQRITNAYLIDRGFSCGIGDIISSNESQKQIRECIENSKLEVNKIIQDARSNKLKRIAGMTYRETLETKIKDILNNARDTSGKFVQNTLLKNNNLLIMVSAGSKGSFINISQVTACVGQQSISGQRIPFSFDSKRSLPHFVSYDSSAESRGFVSNSYLSGLECREMFFHAMGGREGLIDTACKTAVTGYMQRKLIKSMEGIKVEWDGSVRDGGLVSCVYGGDGFDAVRLERVHLQKRKKESMELRSDSEEVRELLKNEQEFEIDKEYLVPFDIRRVIRSSRNKYPPSASHIEGQSIEGQNIEEQSIEDQKGQKALSIEDFFKYKSEILETIQELVNNEAYKKIEEMVNCYLLSSNVKEEEGMTLDAMLNIKKVIKQKIINCKISPQEMVGTLASQSIGQPATQMTLNTFHFAGVTSMEMMGVPRLTEIVDVSSNIKTPSMKIILKSTNCTHDHEEMNTSTCAVCFSNVTDHSFNALTSNIIETDNTESRSLTFAKEAQAKMQNTILGDFFERMTIIYEPSLMETHIKEDTDLVSVYYDLNEEEITRFFNNEDYSKYVIRIIINREKLVFHKLNIENLKEVVQNSFKNDVYTICSDVNDTQQVLRLRCRQEVNYGFVRKLSRVVEDLQVGGIKGISRLFLTNQLSTSNNTSNNSNMNSDDSNTWNLHSTGTSLHKILCNEYVNSTKTITNDLIETYETLGIEAARNTVYNEFNNVIESGGSSVSSRHVELLCDIMTRDGFLRGITRHGTNKRIGTYKSGNVKYSRNSALKRSSFEETVEILMDAGLRNERSELGSVTDSVMVGNLVKMGTGSCEVELDLSILNEEDRQFNLNYELDISKLQTDRLNELEWKAGTPGFSLTSPEYYSSINSYNPKSPTYSETSFNNENRNQTYSPVSIGYSPVSARYSPLSPAYNPLSPSYNSVSPKYSPLSPKFSQASPKYSLVSPKYSAASPKYNPVSQKYSPLSPKYVSTSDKDKLDEGDEEFGSDERI